MSEQPPDYSDPNCPWESGKPVEPEPSYPRFAWMQPIPLVALRDWYAGIALEGIMRRAGKSISRPHAEAWGVADAMMAEREKRMKAPEKDSGEVD
jgi:hypothetical protein